jgi:hypothetical protein
MFFVFGGNITLKTLPSRAAGGKLSALFTDAPCRQAAILKQLRRYVVQFSLKTACPETMRLL